MKNVVKNIEEIEEQWSKKRILIAIVIVASLLGAGVYFLKNGVFGVRDILSSKAIWGANTTKEDTVKKISEGVSKKVSLPLTTIKEKLDNLKKEVANLSVEDIASSSPQIQKIMNDFNGLKEYPRNEAKNICQKICSEL